MSHRWKMMMMMTKMMNLGCIYVLRIFFKPIEYEFCLLDELPSDCGGIDFTLHDAQAPDAKLMAHKNANIITVTFFIWWLLQIV
jgi:hypothetical protein